MHGLRLLVHDLVVVEEHRDAEVLDDVIVTRRVVRRLQERRVQVLEVGQQRLVQGQEALFLNKLGNGILAGHDDVVTSAARVQFGQEFVIAGIEGLVGGHPDLRFGWQLRELREGRGVVVLGPVVDLEVALQGLVGERIPCGASLTLRAAGRCRRAAACCRRRGQDRHPAKPERLAPVDAVAGGALNLAVQVVEFRFHLARRKNVEFITIVVHLTLPFSRPSR